jgi:hypothetical protein
MGFQYGGKGPEILKITWTECAVAFIFYLLRAFSASRNKGADIYNVLGIRLDFVTVTVAIVSTLSQLAILTNSLRKIAVDVWLDLRRSRTGIAHRVRSLRDWQS